MKKKQKISPNIYALAVGNSAYLIDTNVKDNWSSLVNDDSFASWETDPLIMHGVKIIPYGSNNNLPSAIRDIMDRNNLAPGILEREIGLLYGQGPQLYSLKYEGSNISREFQYDKEIWNWLESWNYRRFLEMAMVEYKYLKGFFVRKYLNRGARIGKSPFITQLDVISGNNARLGWSDDRRLESVKNIYVGDFENSCYSGITPYPVFDIKTPYKHPISMSYHCSYSFARNFYSVPSYYGSLRWIMRSSDIPDILKYLSDNGISVAYHIKSPAGYWETKEETLKAIYPDEPDAKIQKRLEVIKDETFSSLSNVLSGKKNTGKFFESVEFFDDEGNKQSWSIEPIDQKVNKFIESQIKISEKADSATTSGIGLHPSLSNIVVGGQLASGSQMLYALKLYLASDTSIAEEIIFEPINQILKLNFPGKNLKLGFYHSVVMKEEDVSPENRVVKST
jgi:hypothetical protein